MVMFVLFFFVCLRLLLTILRHRLFKLFVKVIGPTLAWIAGLVCLILGIMVKPDDYYVGCGEIN